MFTNTFIYLKVPINWKQVYDELLIKMASIGEDLLKECNASCNGENKEYIACWNMFQAACAAFELGQYNKANTLIKYIMAKLDIKELPNNPLVIYTLSTDDARLSQLNNQQLEAHPITSSIDLKFVISHNHQYHMILVPNGLKLINSKYGPIGFETDIYSNPDDTLYSIDYLTKDGIDYTVYTYYSPVGGINELIKLEFAFE